MNINKLLRPCGKLLIFALLVAMISTFASAECGDGICQQFGKDVENEITCPEDCTGGPGDLYICGDDTCNDNEDDPLHPSFCPCDCGMPQCPDPIDPDPPCLGGGCGPLVERCNQIDGLLMDLCQANAFCAPGETEYCSTRRPNVECIELLACNAFALCRGLEYACEDTPETACQNPEAGILYCGPAGTCCAQGEQCYEGGCCDGTLYDDEGTIACCSSGQQVCGNTCCAAGSACNVATSTCEVSTPQCGNNLLDAGEQCDDGNTDNGDGCSSSCQFEESCGDNFINYFGADGIPGTFDDEQCDDGNTVDGDGCSSTCQLELCGNDAIDAGETCDDGNSVDGDGCSSLCQLEAFCGNGVHEPFGADGIPGTADDEQCDDGNGIDGDACSNACLATAGGSGCTTPGQFCIRTDGTQGYECPLGENVEILHMGGEFDVWCQNNIAADAVCCEMQVCLAPGECGNDIINAGEDCDEGADNGLYGTCSLVCEYTTCGDGFQQFPNGDLSGGVTPGFEQCDDGNDQPNDGCFQCIQEICGDGTVHPNGADGIPGTFDDEECDPGVGGDWSTCSPTCHIINTQSPEAWDEPDNGLGVHTCADGIDNDLDGLIDFADPDCFCQDRDADTYTAQYADGDLP